MANLPIADKTTLDAVNTKAGNNTDGGGTTTLFARLRQIYEHLTSYMPSNTQWTNGRAANLDNLNVPVSTRAPADTALNNGVWTNALAQELRDANLGYMYTPSDNVIAQVPGELTTQLTTSGQLYYFAQICVPYVGIYRIRAGWRTSLASGATVELAANRRLTSSGDTLQIDMCKIIQIASTSYVEIVFDVALSPGVYFLRATGSNGVTLYTNNLRLCGARSAAAAHIDTSVQSLTISS